KSSNSETKPDGNLSTNQRPNTVETPKTSEKSTKEKRQEPAKRHFTRLQARKSALEGKISCIFRDENSEHEIKMLESSGMPLRSPSSSSFLVKPSTSIICQ